jgi:hypothetical protein
MSPLHRAKRSRVREVEPAGRRSHDPGAQALLDYWRAELALLQGRLERADSKAGGIVTACVAVAGASATGLAALGQHMTPAGIAVVSVGGLFLLASTLRAVTARDTADKPTWWWTFITVRVLRRGERTGAILAARRTLKGDLAGFEPEPRSDVQAVIGDSLRIRAIAALEVADYTDKQVGDAGFLLFVGVSTLTLGVVLVIAGV